MSSKQHHSANQNIDLKRVHNAMYLPSKLVRVQGNKMREPKKSNCINLCAINWKQKKPAA